MHGSTTIRLVLAAVLVSTAACSPGEVGEATDAAETVDASVTAATPSPKSADENRLPLDAYVLDYEHSAKLEVLQRRLRVACIEGKGLTPPPQQTTDEQAVAQTVRIRRYLDIERHWANDLELARRHGFQMPPFVDGAGKPTSLNSLSEPVRKAWRECDREADDKLEQVDVPQGAGGTGGLAFRMQAMSSKVARSDPRVREAFKQWSSCMADKGHEYATPQDAAGDEQWEKDPGTPEEVEAAVATAECVQSTDLIADFRKVQAEHQQKDIAANKDILDKLKAQIERAEQRIDGLWAQTG